MSDRTNASLLEAADVTGQTVSIGRYLLQRQIARGGMATIHLARLVGDEGFTRIVAAKRLHPEFAEDHEFVAMFLDEARIASKVHHKNVVPVLDVVSSGEEVVLVQEYVHGVPLSWLLKSTLQSNDQIPVNIAVSIACQVLAGLQATHEAVDEVGVPLHIVHRDVSPQNVMIATDGTARLLDFGVAKAIMAAHVTREGTYKGKLAYSAPEQIRGQATPQSDIYSLAVLLWELLVGQRMHSKAKSGAELVSNVLNGTLPTMRQALSEDRAWDNLSPAERRLLIAIDPIVQKGLALDLNERWARASDMEEALFAAVPPAPQGAVAAWLRAVGNEFIEKRDRMIAAEEASFRRISPSRAPLPGSTRGSGIHLRAITGSPVEIVESQVVRSDGKAKKRQLAIIGVCLVGAFLLGGLLLHGSSDPDAGATAAPANGRVVAPQAPLPAPVAPAAQAVKQTAPVLIQAPAAAAPAPEPVRQAAPAPEPREERAAERAEQAPTYRAPRRARLEAPRADPPAEPQSAAAPPAQHPADQAADCSTPYYFEGSKKIFKPACL
jgi:serine/threonine-protein kinase